MATVIQQLFSPSSNFNPKYMMSLFVPTITVQEDNVSVNILEYYSINMINARKALRRTAYVRYAGEQITTIAYKKHNTTTSWWMILYMSQQIHPLLILTGILLSIPDIDAMSIALNPPTNTGARIPAFTTI